MIINHFPCVFCLTATDCWVVSIYAGAISRSRPHRNHSITANGSKCLFFFSQARTNGGGLSTLKAFPHCRTNLQHHCPDQGHFCSKSKAKDGVVNRYPRVSVVHSFLAALSCVNYLQASARQFYGSLGHSWGCCFFFFKEGLRKPRESCKVPLSNHQLSAPDVL